MYIKIKNLAFLILFTTLFSPWFVPPNSPFIRLMMKSICKIMIRTDVTLMMAITGGSR